MTNHIYELPWGELPDDLRFGSFFSEPIRLYRGEKLNKVGRGVGLLSLAAEMDDRSLVYEFGDAVSARNETLIRILMSPHVVYAHKDGKPTPFISASPIREVAQGFARKADEVVVEFEVPVCRTVIGPHTTWGSDLPGEILVIDRVLPEEIIAVHS